MLILLLLRIVVALTLTCSVPIGFAQQTSVLNKRDTALKRKADSLAPQAHISVIPLRGEEMFGNYISNDQQGINFYDVDSKLTVNLGYSDILKIKKGYGGYNFIHKKHTDRDTSRTVVLLFAGILGAVIVAAAVSK